MPNQIISSIPTISVPAFIENNTDKDLFHFKPSEETKKRVTELGLEALYPNSSTDYTKSDYTKTLTLLESNLWQMSATLKTKHLKKYEEKDFTKALNFLETFCLYAAQSNMGGRQNKKVFEVGQDALVLKAIQEIESINKMIGSKMSKAQKIVLKEHIKMLNPLLTKIFTRNLRQTEQIALGKVIEKAKNIINKISK